MESDDQKRQSRHSRQTSSVKAAGISSGRAVALARLNSPTNAKKSGAIENNENPIHELLFNLKDWYRYLLSNWVIIVIAGVGGGILGLSYAWLKKPVYTATTTFVLESGDVSGAGLGQYASLASMVGIDLPGSGGGIFQGDNIIEIYKSRTMIKKTLLSEIDYGDEKKMLIDLYIDFNRLREKWAKKPEMANMLFEVKPVGFNRIRDSIINETIKDINKNYLTVEKPDKKLSLIKVEVKAKDEAFAKIFNEKMVQNVNDFYVRTKTKKLLGNVGILQRKTDSVHAVMTGEIYKATSVSDATPNLNPTRQVQRAAPMQRSQFTAEANKAILTELVKNLELSKISLLKETPLIQVLDQPELPLDVQELSALSGIIIGTLLGAFFMVFVVSLRRIFFNI